MVLALVGGRLLGYVEGLMFEKYWTGLILVPLVLGSFLTYIVTAILTVGATIRGKVRRLWLWLVLSVPVCVAGSYAIPVPSFTDGMRDAVRKKVSAERLWRFADAARLQPGREDSEQVTDLLVTLMKRDFPEIYGLSELPPRVAVGEGSLEIYWGGALVQHWGIKIGSRPFLDAPADYQKGVSYREVYQKIWVYHDRY
ncbi:MAG: hypothetical protein HZA31_06730 [Opitutae bacterium]|nr:hypothetical protein [Opitutae bacterium]